MLSPAASPSVMPGALADGRTAGDAATWSYEQAFARNRGLLSQADQRRLRESCVAIAGLGGVGGVHLMTLVRLGVGRFILADPDRFEAANFNRQCGARLDTLGRPKVEVLAAEARAINPELDIRTLPEAVDAHNVDAFLDGADLLLDGVDFFAIEARRLLFAAARKKGIWAITAGPIGFSAAWLVFDPRGMSFDDYFDLRPGMSRLEQLVAFGVGLAPAGTHLAYLDLSRVDLRATTGPSASLACQLCSGVAASEALKVLLRRGRVAPAPVYHQFDPFTLRYRSGRLWWGNRHPWQRLKRWYLVRRFAGQAAAPHQVPSPPAATRS